MKFKKVYVEISDICGLSCSFCPSVKNKRGVMPLFLFKKALMDCRSYTKLIALHILGDPLKISNIKEYLAIAYDCGLDVEITTSGIYLDTFEFLLKPPIKQINISLDAVMELKSPYLRDRVLKKIFDFCFFRWNYQSDTFINLRIQKREQNNKLLKILQKVFNAPHINLDTNTRVGKKTIIVIKEPFLWNLHSNSSHITSNKNGFCYGLSKHFGILANGDVVPCCMDVEGNIILGNITKDSIDSIMNSQRAKTMLDGFRNGRLTEPYCTTCDYRKKLNLFIV